MKEVYASENVFHLNLMKHFLEDHGIEAFIWGAHGSMLYITMHSKRAVLAVRKEDFERAIELIQKHEELD